MKTNLRLRSKTLAFSMFGFVLLAGCYLLQRGQSAGSLTQRTLIAAIEESGGRFNAGANRSPNRISAVYLPKEALNEIRPTMLAELPNLRALMIIVVLLAMASPARMIESRNQSVIFVLDHSRSLGEKGIERVYEAAGALKKKLPSGTPVGIVAAGEVPELVRYPSRDDIGVEPRFGTD